MVVLVLFAQLAAIRGHVSLVDGFSQMPSGRSSMRPSRSNYRSLVHCVRIDEAIPDHAQLTLTVSASRHPEWAVGCRRGGTEAHSSAAVSSTTSARIWLFARGP